MARTGMWATRRMAKKDEWTSKVWQLPELISSEEVCEWWVEDKGLIRAK